MQDGMKLMEGFWKWSKSRIKAVAYIFKDSFSRLQVEDNIQGRPYLFCRLTGALQKQSNFTSREQAYLGEKKKLDFLISRTSEFNL